MWKKAVLLGALGYAIGIVIGVVIFLCNSSRGFAEAPQRPTPVLS